MLVAHPLARSRAVPPLPAVAPLPPPRPDREADRLRTAIRAHLLRLEGIELDPTRAGVEAELAAARELLEAAL